ncbi:phosphoribosylaminoimidazole-succinocarboxamide synthase [Thermobaculum terrenum ATCC BAA-798]|uniref:Phosphoribosylaminoimidazole-succinocarboxamide synthase n=1 Tax=Thermobaculum terrenum (strain ATCC BAA-798 / CCMEE 7001 / YNP1) TaxID=525904 RepID=D1CG72_THET1|nr:phosphoribosylaminoimidazolesuccinocarboxamide synthase [Thermobaculum terrenum]ACZ41928.1 phosphoribosylaminoimidazole-succinocarboxamide synthase [Thermobaculum terrenum ATCC BAA-798]
MSKAVTETNLPGINLIHRGKVRDTYDLGDSLLMVATDRISAFDWVLPTPIPDKGKVLSQISVFWFEKLADIVPNHFITDDINNYSHLLPYSDVLRGRSMIVKKANRIDYECVVRGYITGSGWAEYKKQGTVAGKPMPEGLRDGDKLPEPIFTPARKNEEGHDENITYEILESEVGSDLASQLRDISIQLYQDGRDYAETRGVIIADTKFEFGFVDGQLTLIDELLTPDSSRFWLESEYRPGESLPSLDKQYVRDWLTQSGWDKNSQPPELPDEVVEATRQRYLEAYRMLTGKELEL